MKKIFTLVAMCTAVLALNAQLIKNDFLAGYEVGKEVEEGAYASTSQGEANPILINQWNLSGKAGNNDQSPESAKPEAAAPLVYNGYSDSGKDVAIDLLKLTTGGRTSIYSLANDNTYGADTYYLAFLSNVSEASSTSAGEFLSFDGNYTGNAQRARYTVKGIDESTYQIGLGDGSAASTFAAGALNFNQTYLSVIKVTLNGDGTGEAAVYVNPELDAEPATPTATTKITGTALKSIRGIVVRQRSTLAAQVSGIRLAKSWSDAIGSTTSSIGKGQVQENTIRAYGSTILTDQSGTIKVFNLTGAEVVNAETTGEYNTNLNKGVYIVKFTNSEGADSTAKIVIK